MPDTSKRPRAPEVLVRPTTFKAMGDHVVAVIDLGFLPKLGKRMTVGIRFVSPEHLLGFVSNAMEQAVKVWPDNPWIKEYQRPEDKEA